MALPDFLVIGAPKAGTTALHAALRPHPRLYMSPVKEPKFFLTDGPPPTKGGPGDAQTYQQHVWRRRDYEALFDGAPAGTLCGESTPFYLHDRAAQERIKLTVPDARLVAVLRDPVDRAHSNWAHMWASGLEPIGDVIEACAAEERRVADGWAAFWRYVDLGRYGSQLRDLYQIFPREQVLVLRYRDLRDRPAATLNRICGFLGVDRGVIHSVPQANVTPEVKDSAGTRALRSVLRAGATVGAHVPVPIRHLVRRPFITALHRGRPRRRPLTPDDRTKLIPYFADDIRLLEDVTGRDFSDWLRP